MNLIFFNISYSGDGIKRNNKRIDINLYMDLFSKKQKYILTHMTAHDINILKELFLLSKAG